MVTLTIGMPVYNDYRFIEKAILSILNQTFTDFELVIFDDCSSDGSAEICQKYAMKDSRIKYFRNQENLGISKNMKLLLDYSYSDYFMWAANDDYWDSNFVKKLIDELENNKNLVSVFTTYCQIDENYKILKNFIDEDYEGKSAYIRIKKIILNPSDGFGYGIFRRDKIKNVSFPIWQWPNKKCPYNNIYPTLLHYLCIGEYKLVKGENLWFNLIKSNENINHKIPYTNSFILCFTAFFLRKLNLVIVSFYSIYKSPNCKGLAVKIFPRLFLSWFIIPVFLNIRVKYSKFKEGDFLVFV